jgi:solute carrier family 35, member C2
MAALHSPIHSRRGSMSTLPSSPSATDEQEIYDTTMRASNFHSIYQAHCVYLPAMLGWFFFSALLSSYNKIVFGSGHIAFPCPLLLTSIHFFVQWVFSLIVSELFPVTLGAQRVREMDWREFLSVSIPCGLVTSGDVGLSNLSLVRISITFYTMVKSSTPVFVLLWAYFFNLETITPLLVLVVAVIAAGECLTVMGEVDYDWIGLIMCLGASVLSGARWTLVQLKLHKMEPPIKTSIATMRVLSPSMFVSMLIISLAIERPWVPLSQGYFETAAEGFHTLGLGLIGAVFSISMILCEFYLILHASAMVLMIGGVVKEMITIIIGVYFFRDELNRINLTGCAIVFLGVVMYKVMYHLQHNETEEKSSRPVSPVEFKRLAETEEDWNADVAVNPQEMELSRILGLKELDCRWHSG